MCYLAASASADETVQIGSVRPAVLTDAERRRPPPYLRKRQDHRRAVGGGLSVGLSVPCADFLYDL